MLFIAWIIFTSRASFRLIYSIDHTTGVDAMIQGDDRMVLAVCVAYHSGSLAIAGGFFMSSFRESAVFMLSLMAYVFVIERRHGLDALRQSKDYIKDIGGRWQGG